MVDYLMYGVGCLKVALKPHFMPNGPPECVADYPVLPGALIYKIRSEVPLQAGPLNPI